MIGTCNTSDQTRVKKYEKSAHYGLFKFLVSLGNKKKITYNLKY